MFHFCLTMFIFCLFIKVSARCCVFYLFDA